MALLKGLIFLTGIGLGPTGFWVTRSIEGWMSEAPVPEEPDMISAEIPLGEPIPQF